MNPWYLLKSKPCQEERAQHFLSLMGVEVFLPMTQEVEARPFFPGYLFARFPLELYVRVGNAFGVRKVVRFGGLPAFVPDSIIEDLRTMKSISRKIISTPKYQRGDEVAIVAGPYKGWYGVFDHEMSGRDRVKILISTLSGNTQGFHQQVNGACMSLEVGKFDLMHA
jgi:transcriptional antiterminator RfaH